MDDWISMNKLFAGLLYDFAGYLTTREQSFVSGASEDPSPVLNHLEAFAKMRGLSLNDPDIVDWHTRFYGPRS